MPESLEGSPWIDRAGFKKSLDAAAGSLPNKGEGLLFRWQSKDILGRKISVDLENQPKDEISGPHAVLSLTQDEEIDSLKLNTTGINGTKNETLDYGDDPDIREFIAMCARALWYGIPPEGIVMAASQATSYGGDVSEAFRTYAMEKRRADFSRRLAERLFL